jgi:4-hydroxybenzoyl-CoA thioesterase
MPRVRVELPDDWPFSTQIDIGVGIIVVDAAIEYKAECRHGELLRVAVARAKTGLLFFDYGTRRVAAMPEGFAREAGLAGDRAP